MSSWPAELRLKTRKILDGLDPFPIEGILRMKNINNFSAYLKQADLQNGQIILYDAETQLATNFTSAGEMFDAGWIADLQASSRFRLLTNTEEMKERCLSSDAAVNSAALNESTEANRVVPFKTCKTMERA